MLKWLTLYGEIIRTCEHIILKLEKCRKYRRRKLRPFPILFKVILIVRRSCNFFEVSVRVLEIIDGYFTNPRRWCIQFIVIWKFNEVHNFPWIFPMPYMYWINVVNMEHFLRYVLLCGNVRSQTCVGTSK